MCIDGDFGGLEFAAFKSDEKNVHCWIFRNPDENSKRLRLDFTSLTNLRLQGKPKGAKSVDTMIAKNGGMAVVMADYINPSKEIGYEFDYESEISTLKDETDETISTWVDRVWEYYAQDDEELSRSQAWRLIANNC